ncbi:MAG: hypothetical protein LQ343_000039 [Gyalolechia ehrenbergii]|nr:MAG: hypothetical protein LQ343_000039 [Gyalolechia ehrenbergii]
MGPPPTKRRRKLVVSSPEDDEEARPSLDEKDPPCNRPSDASCQQQRNNSNAHVIPTRLRSQHGIVPKASKVPTNGSSPPSSPKKPKSKRSTVRKDSKAASLDTYFSAGNDSRLTNRATAQTSKLRTASEQADFIEDDSFDDELRRLSDPRKYERDRDREKPAPSQRLAEKAWSNRLPTGSQVFRKGGNDVRKVEKDQKAVGLGYDDTRSWVDRYGPASIEELAVHKKKVADVRGWLEGVCDGRSTKRLLVLKGASGVGKTATISTLARAMDMNMLEWKNPALSDFTSENYLSASAQFEEFLERSGKFSSLQITSNKHVNASRRSPSPTQGDLESKKRLILVEEFPNISTSNTTSVQSFRTSVLRYLMTDQAGKHGSTMKDNDAPDMTMPLVMIVTESQLNSVTSTIDSFTAHRLLGADILNHPNTDMIEFNSVAPTYITKALNLVIHKEARDSGRRRVPGPLVIKRLSEVGDVRNAIGSLEFLYLKSQENEDWGGKVVSKGKKGAKNAAALTKMEEESLGLVTQREASLGLFHAVGKVIYNKREGDGHVQSPTNPPTQPPDHLPQHVRLRPPDVSVDALINETGTDTQTFVAALHENYVTSCAGDAFTDTLNACIEYLSDTDVLTSERCGRYRGNFTFQGAAMDSLKQDEIAFQVAVRGLLFSLPYPVKRAALLAGVAGRTGGKGDAFKMFYPTSVRLGKQTQEIEEMVECYMRRQSGGGASTASFGGGCGARMGDEVFSWAQQTILQQSGQGGSDRVGACTAPSKDATVLETLPYAAVIERHRPGSMFAEELRQITSFTGEVQPTTEETPDEMGTKRSVSGRKPERFPAILVPQANTAQRQEGVTQADGNSQATMDIEPTVGHLFLSDDDIED